MMLVALQSTAQAGYVSQQRGGMPCVEKQKVFGWMRQAAGGDEAVK